MQQDLLPMFGESGPHVWGGMSRLHCENAHSHCTDVGHCGDPDLWDIMADCSGDQRTWSLNAPMAQ